MSEIVTYVSVNISVDSVGIAQQGFGIPLLLAPNAAFPERVRSYSDLSGVNVDFANTTPEYKMARAIFSQNPHPEIIKMGRCAKLNQIYTVTILSVLNLTAYTVYVNDIGYTYTSDGSATNDEIVAGLVALINAGTGDTLSAAATGVIGSQVITTNNNAMGNYDSVGVGSLTLMSVLQTIADPGYNADLTAIAVEDNNWYFVLNAYNNKFGALAIAAYCEANRKLFIAGTSDSNNVTLSLGADPTTSLMGQVKTSAYKYTAVFYTPNGHEFADCAWVGNCAPFEPGSETWIFKTLSGISTYVLTSTQENNVNNKFGNHYQSVASRGITAKSTMGDGGFIDLRRSLDALEARIKEAVFVALISARKVPFTDAGVAIIKGEILGQLTEAIKAGMVSDDPKPVVTAPLVANVSTANKTNRILPDVKFTAQMAGAIHKVVVQGVVSL